MSYDVAIIGAGMVGLCLAKKLTDEGFRVAIVQNKQLPDKAVVEDELTARVSALNLSSCDYLQELDVWSAPLKKMHVWTADSHIDFDSTLINESELGFIVENKKIISQLYSLLLNNKQVDFYCPFSPHHYKCHADGVTLDLGAQTIDAKLLVGADGAQSWLRHEMAVGVDQRPYNQSAIIAVVHTEKPHNKAALQHFMPNGPLGILPLTDPHHMAIVWSSETVESERLMQLSDKRFNFALTNALDNHLGFISLLTQRQAVALQMRQAREYCAERCVLVGDAAHTIHPLAGQGVNCGFGDVAYLVEVLVSSRDKNNFAALKYLKRYQRERKLHNVLMGMMMRLFKEGMSEMSPVIMSFRAHGFDAVDNLSCLKKLFMRSASKI